MTRWTSTAAVAGPSSERARARRGRRAIALRRPQLTKAGLLLAGCPQCDDETPGPPVALALRAITLPSSVLWVLGVALAAVVAFQAPLLYWKLRLDHITATQFAGRGPADPPRFAAVIVIILLLVPVIELTALWLSRKLRPRLDLRITLCEACEKAHYAGVRAQRVSGRLATSSLILMGACLSSWIYAVEIRGWPRLVAETIEIVSVPCMVGFFLAVLAIVLRVRSAFHTDAAVIDAVRLDENEAVLRARTSFAARVHSERPDLVG